MLRGLAKKVFKEEQARFNAEQEARFKAEQEQERIDFETALELQKQLDEKEEIGVIAEAIKCMKFLDKLEGLEERNHLLGKEQEKLLVKKVLKKQKLEDDTEKEELQVYFNIVPEEENNLSSNEMLSCEPTVSSLNDNEIDFRISFDKSDDEDYMVVFDKNSFSYKIISTNDLKTDSENDNEKVNMPLFPLPKPSVSCIDDLDFFKDFENEFPVIVYNDALTSKLDFSTEPTLCPQHIDEFDLKDETSLSEYDEVE
ncbi:hypothetical protein Tco_0773170 [Tanacetum coccineum]|uniref:Uncharacterized protein n=1 Tax=Tanacetum coccineum TaxID=301880 RepID=A0ABQ4ZJZ2_9ASTR